MKKERSDMMIQRRNRIVAGEELDGGAAGVGTAEVAPEATDLLFEAEDVAELVAEATGEPVEVTADEDSVTFAVGEDEYTVEAEGDEEILEATRRPLRGKRRVSASTCRRPASRVSASRTIRKVPSRSARRR